MFDPMHLLSIWLDPWISSLTIVGLWIALVLGLAEWIARQDGFSQEIPRKIVHIGTGNVILWAWWLHTPPELGLLASLIFCGVTLLSYRLPILASVSGVGRQSWGTFFYALSIGLLMLGFWRPALPQFAVIGVLIMTWGDGLAALIGQRYGTHGYQLWGIQKTWEGSLTMLIVSFLITWGILGLVYGAQLPMFLLIAIAAIVSLWATALESLSRFGLDNLTVPLGSAALCFGCITWAIAR
ncbi:diacylglycerol/polyprenol kinase family protein [Lyngbya confervoides]|uniref:SEC59/DGK1/VTE5 family protein n=1 Tax=Lyngbya confervoides BDU141951 TaxID=1574623 RepID=A0ABD4T8D2_9CYAN|nr:diacylglycerol/polyprenol kinase family protein [Lyngbya confervoides]MCM1985052.1 SEC59/DGK1/VTE5 family protein [Lyngbya confervoides BDU141951]